MSIESLLDTARGLVHQGDWGAALACYREILATHPNHSRARFNAGVMLQELGRMDEAIEEFRNVDPCAVEFSKALANWGSVVATRGDMALAVDLYRRALDADPCDTLTLRNLGIALVRLGDSLNNAGDVKAALEKYRWALEIHEQKPLVLYKMGWTLHRAGDIEAAISHYSRSIDLGPSSGALNNLADLLLQRGDLDTAEALLQRALELDSSYVPALNNLATIAVERGELLNARELYERVQAAMPDLPDTAYNLALLALREQNFQAGWKLYERRFECRAPSARVLRGQELALEDLRPSQTVLVRKEQGLGDQLLFATLLPELAARVARVVVEIDERLIPLFRRSLPQLEFVSPDELCAGIGNFELELGIASLGMMFRPGLDSFRAQPRNILLPDVARGPCFKGGVFQPLIAISWRSFQPAQRHYVEMRKSIPLERFAAIRDAQFLDVQYGAVERERLLFDSSHPGRRLDVQGLDRERDLDGVVSAIEACDLVITACNVTAHLAGAIGKRTWLVYLAANPPFHYWVPGPDRKCLWYPSVEVMSDRSWTTWESAFETIARRWRDRRQ